MGGVSSTSSPHRPSVSRLGDHHCDISDYDAAGCLESDGISESLNERRHTERRGKYSRSEGKGLTRSWYTQVAQHMRAVVSGELLSRTPCERQRCVNGGACMKMFNIASLERIAVKSFGESVLDANWKEDPPKCDWQSIRKKYEVLPLWFEIGRSSRVQTSDGFEVSWKLENQPVCLSAWGALLGAAPYTAQQISKKLGSGATMWSVQESRALTAANRRSMKCRTSEAAAWWYIRLGYYEMVTKEGLILYPRDVHWRKVYRDEFLPYMHLCGYHWRLDNECEQDSMTEAVAKGSISVWYKGRERALQQLGDKHLEGKRFVFKSRAKHSAYKECTECQRLRLAIQDAIARHQPPARVRELDQERAAHLQWMIRQRQELERLVQMATNERMLVENSDKCGDSCLHCPTPGGRVCSANTSLWQYKISLQANVFAGKLFHLSLLLPNLSDGANFGITSFLTGLCDLVARGDVGDLKRQLFRGFDGDSANVCKVGLGMNCVLVKLTRSFDLVQQHRLPPDHSHTQYTDGLFAVIEGWLRHEGFAGARTVTELVQFLTTQFAEAKAYKSQRVSIRILIANFAFAQWLSPHVDSAKLNHIGVPLVWRHRWDPHTQDVISQYKLALSDEATFEKDEWGPWIEKFVPRDDPETGLPKLEKVLRSDPAGVVIMKSYPSLEDNPGLEPWHPAEPHSDTKVKAGASGDGQLRSKKDDSSWRQSKVMGDIQRYTFTRCSAEQAETCRREWRAWDVWHKAHPTSDSIVLTSDLDVGGGFPPVKTSPQVTWEEMWRLLCSLAPGSSAKAPPAGAQAEGDRNVKVAKAVRHLTHPDRQLLASATPSAAVHNVVTHASYTHAQREAALAADATMGGAYLSSNLDEDGALFLIELIHFEGEFRVGLGYRTFNSEVDEPGTQYEIAWYERKSKKKHSWGRRPQFTLTKVFNNRRQLLGPILSVEPLCNFLPVQVQLTNSSSQTQEPMLKEATMSALRTKYPHLHQPAPPAAAPTSKVTPRKRGYGRSSSSEEEEQRNSSGDSGSDDSDDSGGTEGDEGEEDDNEDEEEKPKPSKGLIGKPPNPCASARAQWEESSRPVSSANIPATSAARVLRSRVNGP